ncbi:MAG: hypothetical protein JSV88_03615 [Candidatus Aminicenantes bacterium]|nr:MAG: hypothetical protein JSV88_03615 [Candidatus Aminicenantes bacterium]
MKKMILILLILLFFFLFTGIAYTGKLATLPDHLVPNALAVGDNYFYITENSSIYVYRMKDFKLIKKFGKKGEGPQEFKGTPTLTVLADQLMVNSTGKISFYTNDGTYLKEINNIVSGHTFRPLGSRFIGSKSLPDKKGQLWAAVNIYDSSFNKVKEIYRQKSIVKINKGWWLFSRTYFKYVVCDNKILIAGDKEFVIKVYDHNGIPLPSIKQNYQPVKFTEEHAGKVLDYYRMRPSTRYEYDWWEKHIHFPDYFPAIRDIFKADNLIYVRTFKEKENMQEFFIFAADGKLHRHVFLPIAKNNAKLAYPYMRDSAPFAVKNGKLFQLITDDNKEGCELHVFQVE